MVDTPRAMPIGQEPPPLRHRRDKAKGKPSRRKANDRFALLNAFVDAGMVGLSRVEIATWMVLYRDTRNGIACVSESSIAARVGCSVRAVTAALGKLRRRRQVIQVFRGGQSRGASKYRVWPVPPLPDAM